MTVQLLPRQKEAALVEIGRMMPAANPQQQSQILDVATVALGTDILSSGKTGIVVAGFGHGELFPTLISYEVDGMIADRLKYAETNFVDIDRLGPKAQVIPFAQKEMVERFLYGLDQSIERSVTQFCKETVSLITNKVFESLSFEDEQERLKLLQGCEEAEKQFVQGLRERAFLDLRSKSKAEIEDMVEFMPKPELAKMAEALVNLTSIKRRVSRGMETVGGPIDVALISQSEGFVWIKRKHYFPAELNARYFDRIKTQVTSSRRLEEEAYGRPRRSRGPRAKR